MKFEATLQLGGKSATDIRVPAEVVAALGAGKRPPVSVTINGHSYRSTVAAYGEVFMLPVAAEHRAAAGIAAGDRIEVQVELDTAPRVVELPPDFAAALAGEPAAKRFFGGLSYSNQRRIVLAIEGARTAETRQRRIEKSVAALRDGRL